MSTNRPLVAPCFKCSARMRNLPFSSSPNGSARISSDVEGFSQENCAERGSSRKSEMAIRAQPMHHCSSVRSFRPMSVMDSVRDCLVIAHPPWPLELSHNVRRAGEISKAHFKHRAQLKHRE